MSDLKIYERIALNTFLSQYDEPSSNDYCTFDIILKDVFDGSPDYTTVCESYSNIDSQMLADYISMLAEDIKYQYEAK